MDEKQTIKAIEELEALSQSVLDLKNKVIPRRPIVIEFCGAPKSGKTSCVNSLNLFLRRNKFRTHILSERASICPVQNKYDPYFNIWTVSSAIAELSEVLSNHAKDYDVVIMDRGIFDALCWFNWLLKRKKFDELNFKGIEYFLTMSRWRSVIDFVYVFTADPEVSLKREFSTLLTRKMGSIMHPDILASYKKTLEESQRKYSDVFKTIERIDTSEMELNIVNYRVTKSILDILERNTSEKIGYLSMDIVSSQKNIWFPFKEIDIPLNLEFDTRPDVEEDDTKLQPIPILVITNEEKTKVLVVKKNRNQTPTDSPESQKLLLYFGGHIREEDRVESEGEDLLSVSRYALHREVKEETGVDYYPDREYSPICIWDASNNRSRKHLAMCYVMKTDLDTLKPKIDKNEFASSASTISGRVLDIQEIAKRHQELEMWSRVIWEEILDTTSKEQVEINF